MKAQWIFAQPSKDFIPALSLRTENERSKDIELMSKNALALARWSWKSQKPAGFVYGNVPSGWKLEVSGSQMDSVLFDSAGGAIPKETTFGARKFIFPAVQEGFQLLHMVHEADGRRLAVGVPIVRDVGTWVDLTEPKSKAMKGVVLDATEAEETTLPYVKVDVIGQPDVAAISNASGEFVAERVLYLERFPLYVDTTSSAGRPHRSVLDPRRDSIELYRVNETQIRAWALSLGKDEQALNNLVFGAASAELKAASRKEAYAAAGTIDGSALVQPKIAAVRADGSLVLNGALRAESSERFLIEGAQPGLGRLELTFGDSLSPFWTQLFPISSNYVHIVGSY